MEVIRYAQIGKEDINFGVGAFEVVLADGRVVTFQQVNASHIPGDTVNETLDATQTDVYRARRGMTGLFDFDQNDSTTTGLTWGYTQGMNGDGTGIKAAGTLTLTANSTNYVEWDPETGVISVNTSAFSPTDKVPIRKLVTNASAVTTNTDVRPIWRQNADVSHGQCYLAWTSTSVITLLPLNGNRIIINGTSQSIPAAGVTLSNSGLTVSTTYHIYAYMNAGTMTLEASTTTHATSSTDGVEIKSGDATRSYVGSVDVTGGGNFDTDIRSWFLPTMLAEDARTNSAAYPLLIQATTTGTPAAGIGTGLLFNAESADENPANFGTLEFVATDVTAGSEDTDLVIKARAGGAALAETARVVSDGAIRPGGNPSGTPAAHGLYRTNVPKLWIIATPAGSIGDSFNVASVTDGGAGILAVTIDRDFADANYVVCASTVDTGPEASWTNVSAIASTSFTLRGWAHDGSAREMAFYTAAAFGDQA